ncbi:MAG: TIGR03619 family F420-dependent LLM class oxidoreductase [Chloroflexota bacterium]|nr:TIGR03619 family F420-dependent LLM class oxidoreductase [Chloroflexota bacterium]
MGYHHGGDITLGLVLPPCDEPARLWGAARVAEHHGFHSVWVTDSTLPGYPWLDGPTVLGGVVSVTNTVHIGTSIFVPARRNPVLIAHTLTTLDYLSGGRLIFGVGVGEKDLRPQEYAIAGVPMERRGAVTDEYLGLLRRLWTESAVTHEGRFFQCHDITIEPKPVRQGQIPMWIGGKAEGSLRRAAAYGDGWMPTLLTAADYHPLWVTLGECLRAAGRDAASMTGGLYIFAAIGRSREAARAVLAPGIEAIFHAPFAHFEPLCLLGTADDWVEQIGRFAEVGVSHVNVLLYTQDLLGDVQHIGEAVVPRLRAR